jgi:hypothetical protein
MSQQVSGKRLLKEYEIEYNGSVFNCLNCDPSNCCSTTSANATNKVACQKCRCQQLYKVSDGTRSGSMPVGNLNCTDCNTNMTEAQCKSYEFLNNALIQNVSVVDCSNKMITAGANNTISDVSLTSTCNTGGPTTVANTSTGQSTIKPEYITAGAIAGVVIILIVLFMLFR